MYSIMCVFRASDGGDLLVLFTAIYFTGMTFDFKISKCETFSSGQYDFLNECLNE